MSEAADLSCIILDALNETHEYLLTQGKSGSRGKGKIIKLHGMIRKGCEISWGRDYNYMGFMEDHEGNDTGEKEYTLFQDGAIYPNKVDVAILKDENPVLVIYLKNVDHNYDQNSANYFKNQFAEVEMALDQGVNCIQLSFMRIDGVYRTGGDAWTVKCDASGEPSLNGIKKQDLLAFFRDYQRRKVRAAKLGWKACFDQIIIPIKLDPNDSNQLVYATFEEMRSGRDFKDRLMPGELDKFTKWAKQHTNPDYIWDTINYINGEYEKQN